MEPKQNFTECDWGWLLLPALPKAAAQETRF
jgi:hypothetical protein